MHMSVAPVLIITGASKGIGKATVYHAVTKGNARVVAVARSAALLDTLAAEIANEGKADALITIAGDVTQGKTLDSTVNAAIETWGRIDCVIANAGVLGPIASIEKGPLKEWKSAFDINFFSVVALIQKALPFLREQEGSIIVMSSGIALAGYQSNGVYGASKAALNHVIATLAVEEPRVTSIAYTPGTVDTDMQLEIRENGKGLMGELHTKLKDLHEAGELIPEADAGSILAGIGLRRIPKTLSGKFCSYVDGELNPIMRTRSSG